MALKVFIWNLRTQHESGLHLHHFLWERGQLVAEHGKSFVVESEAPHLELNREHFFTEKSKQERAWEVFKSRQVEAAGKVDRVVTQLLQFKPLLVNFLSTSLVVWDCEAHDKLLLQARICHVAIDQCGKVVDSRSSRHVKQDVADLEMEGQIYLLLDDRLSTWSNVGVWRVTLRQLWVDLQHNVVLPPAWGHAGIYNTLNIAEPYQVLSRQFSAT